MSLSFSDLVALLSRRLWICRDKLSPHDHSLGIYSTECEGGSGVYFQHVFCFVTFILDGTIGVVLVF